MKRAYFDGNPMPVGVLGKTGHSQSQLCCYNWDVCADGAIEFDYLGKS